MEPAFIHPMKALLVKDLPKGPEWQIEVKLDGVRALGIRDGSSVRLVSRAENDLTAKYPELARALGNIGVRKAVLDGEIVALDAQGRPSFQLLQAYHSSAVRPPILYYIFDVLNLAGRSLMGLPLEERKRLAETILPTEAGCIRLLKGFDADSDRMIAEFKAHGLEGLVAKRRDSDYRPGQRNGAWVKYKWSLEQEFVIGGYTQPQGGRAFFGALLVGYFEAGKCLYAGRVGTGFDQQTLRSLHRQFQDLVVPESPFDNLPEHLAENRGLTAREMKRCTWVKPTLVCQVRFAEWTRDGHLRQPSYLGLREDKQPEEVAREKA